VKHNDRAMTRSLSRFRPPAPVGHRFSLRRLAVPLAVLAALVLTGCDTGRTPVAPGGDVTTLIVSEAWMQSASEDVDVQGRLATLQHAITRLREETGTGWIGRQDDVTGYLGELSGGSWPGEPGDFMDSYGPELFGLASTGLTLAEPDATTVPGMVTTRATQELSGVPVLDGIMVFTARAGDTGSDQRLTGVHGRVFPGLEASTEPQLGARQAARLAAAASGGRAEGRPRLVVVPTRSGILTWEVTVVSDEPVGGESGFESGTYYIDATTGEVVTVRRTNATVAPPMPFAGSSASRKSAAEPDPNNVEITGADPAGKELTSHGLRVDTGVELTDTTTPAWDQGARTGGISTYDASAVKNESQLPGQLIVSPDPRIRDADAIAAHAYGRAVIDYYAEMGRDSWDGKGGSVVASVNYGPDDFCNAFFSSSLNPPQMVYGNPCIMNGERWSTNSVYPDVTGHEMTHGVTATSAGLLYAGQSGALNESFSDYFGNIIGNRVSGTDSVAYGEARCVGITEENPLCQLNPDGSRSLRYLLNGNDFDDYLRVLNPGARLSIILGLADQDEGGVHSNSAIWNNALWSIRTQLAKIDNQAGNDSPLAHSFDKAVYGALTTRLGPTAGFVDARAAIEQVVIDSSLDPVVLRVAREVFDANKICAGCPTVTDLAGDPVITSPQAQLDPTVSGDTIAWLDMGAGEFVGSAASQAVTGTTPTLGEANTYDVALAGEAVIAINGDLDVVRFDPAGGSAKLGTSTDDIGIIGRGLVGSDAGAAWASSADSLSFVDPSGTVTTAQVPGLAGDTVISVGTGGGTVAAGTDGGKVFMWHPGGEVRQVATVTGAAATVAPYGDDVLAMGCSDTTRRYVAQCTAKLFGSDGGAFTVSTNATPFGAAMSGDYVVWPEATGSLQAGVAGGASNYPETDLYVLSLETKKVYDLVPGGGQQGFPSISGHRLVWQDAAFGGDDIVTTVLPDGL
jgi:Zn-dependent metalloprotease